MIVAAQMQYAMDEQPLHFCDKRCVVVARLTSRRLDGDDHVAERLVRRQPVADVE